MCSCFLVFLNKCFSCYLFETSSVVFLDLGLKSIHFYLYRMYFVYKHLNVLLNFINYKYLSEKSISFYIVIVMKKR
ncbi:hypothetical protein L1987_61465 [Smallanthus sonchifolius]|uniref:Uncharacterized protein n=1 Tax=Smallanthus sonchifolius TaxID=185202 RepID=A0ACB9C7P4_9ASTR|nr:hypothetical protein L1987_61465 [Smallanthus sonchifolius]